MFLLGKMKQTFPRFTMLEAKSIFESYSQCALASTDFSAEY
jgi:hypothetical protein